MSSPSPSTRLKVSLPLPLSFELFEMSDNDQSRSVIVRAIPTLTFADGTGISTDTVFTNTRFFAAGFVETDRLPSSLSADLFRRIPVALMTFVGGLDFSLCDRGHNGGL
jgi:hypothetical protein